MNHYTILMLGYNSRPWINTSLQSALQQDHPSYDIVAMDDATTDGTGDLLRQAEQANENMTVVTRTENVGQVVNWYDGIRLANDGSIVVILDMDDWFPHKDVLRRLDEHYDKNTWITYGSMYKTLTGNSVCGLGNFPDEVVENNSYRKHNWIATHLRTFRKELALKVDKKDLQYDDGTWFKKCGDLAETYPMLEMSGGRHKFIEEPLYVYNETNPNSDFRVHSEEQLNVESIINNRSPYAKLDTL